VEITNKRHIWLFFSVLIFIMAVSFIINTITSPQQKPLELPNDNNSDEIHYITIRDTNGKIILETGLPVYEDDEYIDETNIHYVIISVQGSNAIARVKDNNVSLQEKNKKNEPALNLLDNSIPAQASPSHHVVIYHTHTDESYVPTSGKASEPGKGDVFQVGSELKQALNKAGISVTHSTEKHDPHDINAYHRSRRTVVKLLKERPDAAFDIHRDSAPAEAYVTTVNGVYTSRVMIVIGRSNPNMQTNLEYAKRIKAKADELHPGLMRGIFLGKGDYNQDLYPTALLFEVGTENLSLDAAQKAVRCLSDAIIAVFYE